MLHQNAPFCKSSRFAKWYQIFRYEYLNLISVSAAMGIEYQPNLPYCCLANFFNYTKWYHEQFFVLMNGDRMERTFKIWNV